jgi:hypothetical protein
MNSEVEYQRHLLFALSDKGSLISETEMLRLLQEGWPCEPTGRYYDSALIPRNGAIVVQDVSLAN